jgi:hypothetical protein
MAFPMNIKSTIAALACACAFFTQAAKAIPILDVEAVQTFDRTTVSMFPSGLAEGSTVRLFIDDIFVIESNHHGATFTGRIGDAPAFSVGEHFVRMDVSINGILESFDGDESYFVLFSLPAPSETNVPDGGSSGAMLAAATLALIGLRSHRKIAPPMNLGAP